MLTFILLLAVAYLLFSHNSLKTQIKELQAHMRGDITKDAPAAPIAQKSSTDDAIQTKELLPAWEPAKPKDKPEPTPIPTPQNSSMAETETPPAAFVFNAEKTDAFASWLKENWFYAIAAISLALSGVFFVQYGIENGYLTPFWRVMGALSLGGVLIMAGEWIRRHSGDGADSHTAYLPSVFSGAGLVALFAGVLAARQMYGLIGPETALIGLVAVSALAVVLGWFYGPVLAMVGIIGATAAPFMVGGSSEDGWLFYYYFAMILVTGMLVDAFKRWAWVCTLALIASFGAAYFTFLLGAGGEHLLGFALIAAAAAAMLPTLRFWPNQTGEMLSVSLWRFKGKKPDWSEFPTRIAAGGFGAAVVSCFIVSANTNNAGEVWLAIFALAALLIMAAIWFKNAPALRDLIALPPLAFLAVIFSQANGWNEFYTSFMSGSNRPPETAPPWDVTVLIGMALIGSALIFWRSMRESQYRLVWAGGIALFAPMSIVVFEVWWTPVRVLGQDLWAWHAMAVAITMTLLALQSAKADGDDHRRAAIYALSAMTMIKFALVVMLSSTALTLAIALMVLLAALIDRQLKLQLLSVFVQVGGVVVGYRLLADPGVLWAYDAPLLGFIAAYAGSIAMFAAAWFLLQARGRRSAIIVMESAVWTLSGIFASVALFRHFGTNDSEFLLASTFALVWLISAANQLYRLKITGWMRWVRLGLAGIFGSIGMLAMLVLLTAGNPLLNSYVSVTGPFIFDSLMLGYLLPAMLFGFVAWRFDHLYDWFRIILAAISAGLAAFYIGLEIRRFWQGDILSGHGTTDGELYSYTIAMLLISVALLFFGFSKRSTVIRKLAVIGIGLTIAKVFLIDMSGLQGLIRVASFLGLGLSLAGLAWISQRMNAQWDQGKPTDQPSEGTAPLG